MRASDRRLDVAFRPDRLDNGVRRDNGDDSKDDLNTPRNEHQQRAAFRLLTDLGFSQEKITFQSSSC